MKALQRNYRGKLGDCALRAGLYCGMTIVLAVVNSAVQAEVLTPLNPGSDRYFPTRLICPEDRGTGTLETVQEEKRQRAGVRIRLEYNAGSLHEMEFYARVKPLDAWGLQFKAKPRDEMTARTRGLFDKAKAQGDTLLREVCLGPRKHRDEFMRKVETNAAILDGKLNE
jgi:hypothetical protein